MEHAKPHVSFKKNIFLINQFVKRISLPIMRFLLAILSKTPAYL